MFQRQPSYDVVILGSGHNGLVAAAYLAKAGKSVLVLERLDYLGGATTSQRLFPEYDALLSRYSYLVSLLPDLIVQELGLEFRTLGRSVASFTPYEQHDGQPSGLILSNTDPVRTQASIEQLTGSNRAWSQYQAFLELQRVFAQRIWPSWLEPLQSKQNLKKRMVSALEREAWRRFVEEPIGVAIEDYSDNDVLRGVWMTDAKIGISTHPHDPSLLQNRCFVYHVIGNGTGQWNVPVGGMGALTKRLVDLCKKNGVAMLTHAPATRVELGTSCHRVTYTVGDDEHGVDCRYVLVNAAPSALHRLMGSTWTPVPRDEGSVIKVNMLLHRLPRLKASGVSPEEAFTGSFHLDEGYQAMQRSHADSIQGRFPTVLPCEMYCHTLTDPSILGPELQREGYQTLTLFGLDMPYSLFTQDNEGAKQRVLARYLEALNRVCAEPFEDCIAKQSDGSWCWEIKSPIDLENEVGLDLGNIFHRELSWFYADSEQAVGTWGVETEYPRVLLSGSSAKRGGGVSGIPGRNAAMCVLEQERLQA